MREKTEFDCEENYVVSITKKKEEKRMYVRGR